MSEKKTNPTQPWYLDPNLKPIHEWGDGQQIKQTFAQPYSNGLGNLTWRYAILTLFDDGELKSVVELEDGETVEKESD